MGTTAGGLPYPEPSDPIAQGAAAIRSLAEAVDGRLADAKFGALQVGTSTVTTDSTGNATITHTLGVAPTVIFAMSPNNWAYNVTPLFPAAATTFSVRVRNVQTGADIANQSLGFRWLVATAGTI